MLKGLIVLAVTAAGMSVYAQSSSTTVTQISPTEAQGATAIQESTLKMNDVIKNEKFEEDKDITDTRLKADSGSLSRYSLKFSLSYFGPPVGDLSNENQPNPNGSIGPNETSVGGSISGRYRLDSKTAISMGTGISMLTPFHGVKRTDVKTPFISYDRSARVWDAQMRNSFGASVTTVPNYRDVGQVGTLSYDNNLVYNFGSSGFAAGVDSSLSYFLYERDYEKADKKASRYFVGFYPQVKYNFTDKLNVYTSVALNFMNPRWEAEPVLLNQILSGRLGMGYGYSRDIYIAPYLNFYPENLRGDNTTFSVSTIFSIL
ncbi:hypothetical protein AZI86_09625 [Bdellovibrio bacteriovorus]|uniref:Uncharacterized protein n=1 Tax=Bdellovibrio bacteriovorus TaxID=959 RepID=A0A150WSF5_BDEBC|nr:hypothetical protein [Bdellovibrio bacteriovorus]KYG67254.1 hypothetical protein AZI86_09625 [Bdellovibrio bacteriovorus]